MKKHYGVLLELFSRHASSGKPVDASRSFTFLGFDLVSELTFGKSWNMLSTGEPIPLIAEFMNGKRIVGFLMLDMWINHLMLALPPIAKRMNYWLNYYERVLKERKEVAYPL